MFVFLTQFQHKSGFNKFKFCLKNCFAEILLSTWSEQNLIKGGWNLYFCYCARVKIGYNLDNQFDENSANYLKKAYLFQ